MIPLHDIQAEKELLSSALFKESAIYKLMECDESMFYGGDNRAIFTAMQDLYTADQRIDMASLRMALAGKVNDAYLAELATCAPVVNVDYIITELRGKAYKRELMDLAKDLYKSVQTNGMEFNDFMERIIKINEELNAPVDSMFTTMADMSDMNLDDIFVADNYVKTKIPSLDGRIIGLFKGQLIVIAAPPGMGKTTLAWQIACNIHDSIFISMEMKRQELYAKLLSRYTGISTLKIESKCCTDDEIRKLVRAQQDVKRDIRLTLFDSDMPYFKLLNTLKKMCKQKPVSVIIIDYLQLIEGAPGENKEDRISTITRTCKKLAFGLNIPVVLLSQLTKDVLKEGREPTLGDLRGSGAIGQDADMVIFLYEKDVAGSKNHFCTVAKLRKGAIGTVGDLQFNKACSRFDSIDYAHSDTIQPGYFQD